MRLIDADALKGAKFYSHERHEKCVSVYAIDMMPTIEPEQPHGEWVEKTGMIPPEDKGVKFCSNCMNRQPRDFIRHTPIEPDFCPWCGSYNRPKIHGCIFASEECKKNPCKDCGLK